ncbi:MAG: EAL domain-containing protein [Sneathiella sp.]|nr:EAL domain-containing protein [Sneathiella sp.]
MDLKTQRKGKIILFCTLVSLLLGGIFYQISFQLLVNITNAEFEKRALRVAERAQNVVEALSRAGLKSKSNPNRTIVEACSETGISDLRKWVYYSNFVGDLGFVKNNRVHCSALLGIITPPFKLEKPDKTLNTGAEFRVLSGIKYTNGEKTLAISNNDWIFVMKPTFVNRFKNMDVQKYDLQLYIRAASDFPFVSIGSVITAKETSWSKDQPTHWSEEYLYARSCGTKDDICSIVRYPISATNGIRESMNLWIIYAAILVSLLTVFTTYGLYNRQQSLSNQLKRAIREGHLQLAFQPIIMLSSGRCVGAECLLRWNNKGEWIRPDHFIQLAEDKGFIQSITKYVVQKSMREMSNILQTRPEFRLTINVTAGDLHDGWLKDQLMLSIKETSISPTQIGIELTERSLANLEEVSPQLQALREMGFSILIDDFGTGYSSLSYIHKLPFDVMKIDKSFIDSIGTDGVSSGTLPHIIEMGHGLDVELIAEGVESTEQVDWLKEKQVKKVQGWVYSKALPLSEFEEYLSAEE